VKAGALLARACGEPPRADGARARAHLSRPAAGERRRCAAGAPSFFGRASPFLVVMTSTCWFKVEAAFAAASEVGIPQPHQASGLPPMPSGTRRRAQGLRSAQAGAVDRCWGEGRRHIQPAGRPRLCEKVAAKSHS